MRGQAGKAKSGRKAAERRPFSDCRGEAGLPQQPIGAAEHDYGGGGDPGQKDIGAVGDVGDDFLDRGAKKCGARPYRDRFRASALST